MSDQRSPRIHARRLSLRRWRHPLAVAPATVAILVLSALQASAAVTAPTPQEQPNIHQAPNSVLTICQDGNWDSDFLGSYQVEMGKWHAISSAVPTYNYVGTTCTSASGKLWLQQTSACGGSWIGCTNYWYDTTTDQITYFDLTVNSSYCYSTLNNLFAYFQCFDRDTVVGHEAGHSIGLDHNQIDNRSIMWPTQNTLPDARSDPDDNDAAGIHAIYG